MPIATFDGPPPLLIGGAVGRPRGSLRGGDGGERRRLLGALLLGRLPPRRLERRRERVLGRRREAAVRAAPRPGTCGIERYAAVASGSDPATPPGSDATSDGRGRCRRRRRAPVHRVEWRWRGGGGALSSTARATVAGLASSSSCDRRRAEHALVVHHARKLFPRHRLQLVHRPSAVAGRTRSARPRTATAALRQHGSTGAANGSSFAAGASALRVHHRRREREGAVRDVRRVGSRRAHEHGRASGGRAGRGSASCGQRLAPHVAVGLRLLQPARVRREGVAGDRGAPAPAPAQAPAPAARPPRTSSPGGSPLLKVGRLAQRHECELLADVHELHRRPDDSAPSDVRVDRRADAGATARDALDRDGRAGSGARTPAGAGASRMTPFLALLRYPLQSPSNSQPQLQRPSCRSPTPVRADRTSRFGRSAASVHARGVAPRRNGARIQAARATLPRATGHHFLAGVVIPADWSNPRDVHSRAFRRRSGERGSPRWRRTALLPSRRRL